MPDTPKACIALTIWGANIDADHTISVSMGTDGSPATTVDLGTFTETEPVQTIFLDNVPDYLTDAIGKFIQLRFTFTSNDDDSPLLYAYELHTQAFFEPIKVWTVEVSVGQAVLRTGVFQELTKTEIEALFRRFERQIFPPVMEENFDQLHPITTLVRLVDFQRLPMEDDARRFTERWRLTLQEATAIRPEE